MENISTSTKIYVYTTKTAREKGVYKVGGTRKEVAAVRINEQDGTACWEPLEEVWSSEFLKDVWDDQVREKLFNYGLQSQRVDKNREWVTAPEGAKALTDESVVALTKNAINSLEDKGGLKVFRPKETQKQALEAVVKGIEKALAGDQTAVRGVLDLCARFGKTLWVLWLFETLRQRLGYSVLLLPAYWLSAHSSFEKEIEEFRDFNHLTFIDTSTEGWQEKLTCARSEGSPIVVSLSLCGDASKERLQKFNPIRDLPQDEVFLFCDEADVGAHTERSARVLKYVFPSV
jgi:hypothetical protein